MALDDDVTELLILWPHLETALVKDAGTNDGPVVSGGTDPAFGLPLNADVLMARTNMQVMVPELAAWAADTLAEPRRRRDVPGHLRHVTRWHDRMRQTAALEQAAHLESRIRYLLGGVKLAIGLRVPDRVLPDCCPLHDDPLTLLTSPGAEAQLRWKRFCPTSGELVGVSVVWSQWQAIVCRHCGVSWTPGQYAVPLARQLREARARRARAVAALQAGAA